MTEDRDGVGVSAGAGIGGRIRAARVARGMSRAAVANLCGRSEEWLRQIERGKRGTGLHMLAKLADVLRIRDFGELLGDNAPTAMFTRPEHPALGEVRRAVVSFGPADPESAPGNEDLRERVRYAWQRRSVSHRDRTDLAEVLPDLLVGAQHAARAAQTPTEQLETSRLLAEVYHLGQLYLCYQGDARELLWVVVDRAMAAALESEDAATVGRAAWFSAYLFRDFGAVEQAHQVAEDALRHLDPAEPTGHVQRQRCVVHLASAWNHARDGQPALAWRAWDAAVEADRDATPESPHALFGATVGDVALSLDVELGRALSAVRRAEATDVEAVTSTPRRARLAIEAARGYLLRREYAGAVHLLRRAYEVSAEATLFSMHARSMANDLLSSAGPMLRGDVVELADKLGVAA